MIPGSISKVSEGIVACAGVIKVYNDLVRVTGSGTINTINPGLGTAQGQYLMIVPMDGTIKLGTDGNILTQSSISIPKYHVVTLIFSKPLQKWLLAAATGIEEDDEMETVYIPFDPTNFFADNGTWTIIPSTFGNFYYIHGKRVTMTLSIGRCSISPDGGVRAVRMKLPAEVSNIARQGPYGSDPSGANIFLGAAVVYPSGIASIVGGSTDCFAAVADNAHGAGEIGAPYFGVAPKGGNFPTTPPESLSIIATVTYILA